MPVSRTRTRKPRRQGDRRRRTARAAQVQRHKDARCTCEGREPHQHKAVL